jgi:hypothetical protein
LIAASAPAARSRSPRRRDAANPGNGAGLPTTLAHFGQPIRSATRRSLTVVAAKRAARPKRAWCQLHQSGFRRVRLERVYMEPLAGSFSLDSASFA